MFMPVVPRSDQELVRLALSGDKEAFGQLAERHMEVARRIAARMLWRDDIAQELVQEALLQAYLSLDRLREAQLFKSWLFGIVLNLCRSYLREQKRGGFPEYNGTEESAFDPSRVYTRTPEPEKVAEERELHRLVLAAIEDLLPSQKEVTLLFYYEFLSLQEIANLLGTSVGAVKMRLNRARGQLREQLLQNAPEVEKERKIQPRRKQMVKVTIADVVKQDQKYIVMLKDEAGERILQIWIGPFEGESVAMGVGGFRAPRPLTFNFIANILQALGAELEEVRVDSLKDETFYGTAKIRIGNEVKEVDARPSDVLALAVRTGSPIYVSEGVMERAAKPVQEFGEAVPNGEGIREILKEVEEMMRSFWPKKPPEEGARDEGKC
jgi:RNA polymerase sigma factor (sigma-70 family)